MDRIAAQFKLCTVTLGSLQYLTGAIGKAADSYESIIYRAIIDGIRDYNLDMQKIKRLLNERIRIQLNDSSFTLPKSIAGLIKHLVPSTSKKDENEVFHFTTSILSQMVKTLGGNFSSIKATQTFAQLKKFVSRKLHVFFGTRGAAASDDDNTVVEACSTALLRVILGKGGLLNQANDDEVNGNLNDESIEIDEKGMLLSLF